MSAPALPRVLVAEDDLAMGTLLREYLADHGYAVTLVHDGEAAARLGERGEHDLVVLDVMLPGRDGFASRERACQRATARRSRVSGHRRRSRAPPS